MFKENIKNRVESNKCPICWVEFTKEYLKTNEIRNVFYTDFGGNVKICKKNHFFEENTDNAI